MWYAVDVVFATAAGLLSCAIHSHCATAFTSARTLRGNSLSIHETAAALVARTTKSENLVRERFPAPGLDNDPPEFGLLPEFFTAINEDDSSHWDFGTAADIITPVRVSDGCHSVCCTGSITGADTHLCAVNNSEATLPPRTVGIALAMCPRHPLSVLATRTAIMTNALWQVIAGAAQQLQQHGVQPTSLGTAEPQHPAEVQQPPPPPPPLVYQAVYRTTRPRARHC